MTNMALYRARKAAELTKTQLAEQVGVDVSYISLLESGKRDVGSASYDILTCIARVLNVSPDSLLPPTRKPKRKTA
jgi:transcriptional regulator with XRE-family HTH domain